MDNTRTSISLMSGENFSLNFHEGKFEHYGLQPVVYLKLLANPVKG